MNEFYAYVGVNILLFILIILTRKGLTQKPSHIMIGLFLLLFFLYDLSIRSFPQADMVTYRQEVEISLTQMRSNTYFLREFIFWIGSALLFFFTHSKDFVFAFWDTLCVLILLRVRKNFNLPTYGIVLIAASFFYLQGLENIYRQFIATNILLLSLSYAWNSKRWKAICLFFFSVFTHNSMALFFPLILISFPRITQNWKLLFTVGSIGLVLTLPLAIGTKSEAETGLDLKYGYLAILSITAIPIYFYQSIIKRRSLPIRYHYIIVYLLLMYTIMTFFLGGIAERIGMSAMIVLLPIIILFYETEFRRIENIVLYRVFLYALYVLPTFLFESTLYLLSNRIQFI